jgi:hypothetical protein
LKGQLSEYELHTLRARLTAGLLNKAKRGELALQLPVGLMRDALGRVRKDPNQEVQDRLALVFSAFLEVRSASKVLQHFNAHGLLLPRRDRFGEVIWKQPTVPAFLGVLKNPAYAGAFVYGRTRTTATGPLPTDKRQQRLPMEQWKITVKDVYPAYVPWDTFERIQAMLRDNYAEYDRNKTRGIPRPGKALLHGIVCCGECGHKMVVQYKTGTRYICNYLRQQYHVPVCQYIPADPVDDAVVAAFFQALSPVELDAYAAVVHAQQARREQIDHAHQQQLTRLRYEAELAKRQFLRSDPDNRLVTAELEKRWEEALRALQQAEESAAQPPAPLPPLPPDLQARFQAIGQHLPQLWAEGIIGQAHKKALLRCLIDTVIVQRVERDRVQARIVWKGGETTTLQIPIPVGSWSELSGAETMEQTILEQSAQGISDEDIAASLTAQGYRSPLRPQVLPSTVKSIRLQHRLFRKRSQSHPRQFAGFLTVPQITHALGLTPHWIYDRINNGTIVIAKDPQHRLFLFPDAPSTLEQFRQLKEGTLKTLRF